ncbi:MAG: HAD-IIIA family hydrolase [Deltaproteobacteria bacterium]|jgi:D-glycero-D-manno-heptose 1,7-bisphosphate phosphatase|nr:HAD-IIIA family hydrolase [Deltaproteobacteria bacterium]
MGKLGQIAPRPAVFLDRDGVLNEAVVRDGKPYPPADADSLVIPPDTLPLLRELKEAGYWLICVTNQPDVARGTRTLTNVLAMCARVSASLPLDATRVCLHDGADRCPCRKPQPGMLLEAAAEFSISLAQSFMVGDRASDVGAGRAAGTRTIFIDRGYREPPPDPPADFVRGSLAEAVALILSLTERTP